MEPIDVAAQRLATIRAEVEAYQETIFSEQDTRLKVINRVLHEILGWPLQAIATEEAAGTGFIDYKLSIEQRARLVVEAKRDGRELGLAGRAGGRAFKLNGPVFSAPAAKEGIEQGIRYCGQKNAELACVTNGREWVVFRGSRLGDGRDTLEGMAFVFPSFEAVEQNFARFYDLLSYEAVKEFRYRAHFQEVEGRPIRAQDFRRAVRDPNTKRLLHHSDLANDIDRVMTSFFRRLSGDEDPDFLVNCFVVTRESQVADERLARISEELIGRIRNLNTASGEQLTELVERAAAMHRNEFVLVVGTKGAGKTTFIDRFFRYVLPDQLREDCIVARVNVADSDGSETGIAAWMNRNLLQALETTLFGDEGPTFEEIQGMFFDEYRRLSTGPWRPLYERDPESFKIDFGRLIEQRREERPHEYIQGLVRHIVRNRKKMPCLVLDNADHFTIEFQERVFQYARSIYEGALCLVIMPITDRTSWQLSREGALRSFENESLFLPTPLPKTVLRKRIDYLETRLASERRQAGYGYFLSRGIRLSIEDLTAFTAALQAIFLRSDRVATWIGNLANHDIRRCLEIAQSIVTSPHLAVHELISAYVTGSDIDVPLYKIKRALIRGQYDIYPGEVNKFVRNIYTIDNEIESSPLLGLRLMQLLRDARRSGNGERFITVEQTVEYCRAMHVDASVTLAWLSRLLDTGLCLSYDPTVTTISNVDKIELSLAGYQHLRWGMLDIDYIEAMLEVTPLIDEDAYERLVNLTRNQAANGWRERVRCFVDYLIEEDKKYVLVPQHEAYTSQRLLNERMGHIR